MGLAALDLLRIEAGLIFADYEFTDQTDPFEAGIGFTVPLKTKPDDFIGREALIRRKENPRWKLVGLDIDSRIPAHHGDCLHIGRAQVGEITSAMWSPLLDKQIAPARVDVTHATEGTEIEVGKLDGQQKRLPAHHRLRITTPRRNDRGPETAALTTERFDMIAARRPTTLAGRLQPQGCRHPGTSPRRPAAG